MKKSLKALAVLSLFGLGLGSVTACGNSSKTISISVNGESVPEGGVHLSELSTVTFSASVFNGSDSDVVKWSTNATNVITFESTTGTEVKADLDSASTTGWVVTASLENDPTITSSILVYIDEVTKTYGITVDTTKAKTNYLRGDTFTSENLIVNETVFVNGEPKKYYEIGKEEYTLSISEGSELTEVGTFDVKVTATDTSLGETTYKITVGKNDLFALNRNFNYYTDNTELEMTTIETADISGKTEILNNQMVANWGDYAFDSSNMALYHSENGGIRKFDFFYDESENVALNDTGYVYDSYLPIQGDPTVMFDLNMVMSASDLTIDMFKNSTLIEEDAENGLYLYQIPSSAGAYSFMLSSTLFGQISATLNSIKPGSASTEVLAIAGPDYTTQIMLFFETSASVAESLDIPANAISTVNVSPVSLTATSDYTPIEVELQNLVESKEYGKVDDKLSDTFRQVVGLINKGNFDATFGNSLFADLNYEYHGTDDYFGIAENIINFPSDSSGNITGNPTSIKTNARLFFDVDGKKFEDHTFAEDTTAIQFIYGSEQKITVDESGKYPTAPTEFKSVAGTEFTTKNTLEYKGVTLTDMQPFHPSTWNGFITDDIEGLDMNPVEYWDKVSESSFVDEGTSATVVQGSYNLYGSLYLQTTSDETFVNDMWSNIQSFSNYYAYYNQEYLNFSNCKINLQYQLVDGDWNNENSYIRIYTYVADHSSEESYYKNQGYVDIMEISNIGKSSYKPAEEFVSLLTPIA